VRAVLKVYSGNTFIIPPLWTIDLIFGVAKSRGVAAGARQMIAAKKMIRSPALVCRCSIIYSLAISNCYSFFQ